MKFVTKHYFTSLAIPRTVRKREIIKLKRGENHTNRRISFIGRSVRGPLNHSLHENDENSTTKYYVHLSVQLSGRPIH